MSDTISVIACHWGADTQIYVLRGEIEPGESVVEFVMGTGWDEGQRFRAIAKLKLDAPYDALVLPDATPEQIRLNKQQRLRKGMVAIYDLLELQLRLHDSDSDRVEVFRFRRITN